MEVPALAGRIRPSMIEVVESRQNFEMNARVLEPVAMARSRIEQDE